MRVLRAPDDHEFSLIEFHATVPPHAILSHTEGKTDEVTFKDVIEGRVEGKRKPGYAKLRFWASQAAKDRLK
jgi:hypothetical protein